MLSGGHHKYLVVEIMEAVCLLFAAGLSHKVPEFWLAELPLKISCPMSLANTTSRPIAVLPVSHYSL